MYDYPPAEFRNRLRLQQAPKEEQQTQRSPVPELQADLPKRLRRWLRLLDR